jgi:hypothetical protein
MAGRPRIVRSIQSYINHTDTHSGIGVMKAGTAPKVGVSRNFWYNYQSQCNQGPNDFINTYAYYNTLQFQKGSNRPPFRKNYTTIINIS